MAARFRRQGTTLLLSGVHAQPLVALDRSGALDQIGRNHLFGTFEEAVAYARALLEDEKHSAASGHGGQGKPVERI